MRPIALSLLPCLLLAAASLPAEALDLNAVYRLSLKRSEAMASQAEQVVQAEARATQAWSGVLPNLSAYGSYGLQDDLHNGAAEQKNTRLTLAQPLFRGFRAVGALKQAGVLVKYQAEARRWAGLQLWADTAQALYAAMALAHDLDLLNTQIQLYDQRVQDLQGRVAIGRSRKSEVLTIQTAQAILKAQREQLLGQSRAADEVLRFITGLSSTAGVADPGSLPALDEPLATWLTRLDQRPDLAAARYRSQAAELAAKVACGGHLPSLDLTADYYHDRSAAAPWPAWDVTLGLTLPLFQGFATSGKVDEAESSLRDARLAEARARRAAEQELSTLHQTLQADLRQAAALDQAYELSEKNYKVVKADYDLGLLTNQDVLSAMSSYQDTARALEKARLAAHSDYQRLRAAAAIPTLR